MPPLSERAAAAAGENELPLCGDRSGTTKEGLGCSWVQSSLLPLSDLFYWQEN